MAWYDRSLTDLAAEGRDSIVIVRAWRVRRHHWHPLKELAPLTGHFELFSFVDSSPLWSDFQASCASWGPVSLSCVVFVFVFLVQLGVLSLHIPLRMEVQRALFRVSTSRDTSEATRRLRAIFASSVWYPTYRSDVPNHELIFIYPGY
jgi:hypothetical protein